jgi:hypothetical protein
VNVSALLTYRISSNPASQSTVKCGGVIRSVNLHMQAQGTKVSLRLGKDLRRKVSCDYSPPVLSSVRPAAAWRRAQHECTGSRAERVDAN